MKTHPPRRQWRRFASTLLAAACALSRALPLAIGLSLSAGEPPKEKPPEPPRRGALESIESTRGGRHWVDAKTDPPKSPDESLACFQIEPGYRVELVAAEPIVIDPVAIAFDELGRMFVAEYGDYPTGPPNETDPPLSRIVMLEDTDSDGRMDTRHVFADRLSFAHSLAPFRGGIVVGARTEIVYLKDTDDDHKADLREVLFSGFVAAHPQMQIGNPRWGFDNWIYLNYGPGEISVGANSLVPSADPKPAFPMPSKEFRFHPLTLEFGPASGLGQFGNTIDNYGHRFFSTNRNPIMAAPLSFSDLRRNPFFVASRDHYDVGPSGGDTLVYPLVEMKSNYLSHAGTHTSACGTTAYCGDLLGPRCANSVFVCEPIGHLVTRSIVKPVGATLTADRARVKADFLSSTDTWFRPASLATGPDGALYLADMYRLWVEHPKFLPEEIAKRLDWRAGDDRGRVWRVVPDDRDAPRRSFQPPDTTDSLVAMLADANGWRRQLAQRLLVERQIKDAAPRLRELLAAGLPPNASVAPVPDRELTGRAGDAAFGRLHALWTLDGLGELTSDDVVIAMVDPDVHVRRDAVKLSARYLSERGGLVDRLEALVDDPEARVRLEVALALGETDDPRTAGLLAKLARRDGGDPWFVTAILTSTKERSGAVLAHFVESRSSSQSQDSDHGSTPGPIEQAVLVRELATVVGARGDHVELVELLRLVGGDQHEGAWWRNAALSGLATGLPRHQGALGRMSLTKLLADPPDDMATVVAPVRALLARLSEMAVESRRSIDDRVVAVELLGYQPFDQGAAVYGKLLAIDQPVEVRLATVKALQRSGNDAVARIILEHWPTLGPQVQPSALNLLLSRANSTLPTLQAMDGGLINPAVVDIDQRVRLLQHADASISGLATKLFGGAVSANRREVAEQFNVALTAKASSEEGIKVFDRVCAKCHRVDGRGHEVGPDISDVRSRSRDALLYDILDPNQKLEPRFTDYLIVTTDGRILNGLMVSETAEAVVLRQPEGKESTIARNEIDEIRPTGKSLMPEGVEKDVTVQEMADLLEYLKGRRPGAEERPVVP